jgi:hypothetical protein
LNSHINRRCESTFVVRKYESTFVLRKYCITVLLRKYNVVLCTKVLSYESTFKVRKYLRSYFRKYESTRVLSYESTFEGTNVYVGPTTFSPTIQYCIFVRTEVLSYDTSGSLILSRTFESTMYVYTYCTSVLFPEVSYHTSGQVQ